MTRLPTSPSSPQPGWSFGLIALGYVFERGQALTSGLKISLAASNLFDKAPPYAKSPGLVGQGINFDSTNASAMGRQISLTVTKAW